MRASDLRAFAVAYSGGGQCAEPRCDSVVVLARHKEDIEWLAPLAGDHSFVIHGLPLQLPFLAAPPRLNTYVPGREEAKYLAYIIMEYDRLPSRMVFLHAHDLTRSVHEKFIFKGTTTTKAAVVAHLLSWLGGWGVPSRPFVAFPGECRTVFAVEYGMETLWKQVNLSQSIGTLPEAWDSVCCAQFAVSKEAVLQRPRRVYEDLYDWILTRQFRAKKEKKLADSTMALEHSWRWLFENVTARPRSPCDDLEPPFANKRVKIPNKPGLKKIAKRLKIEGMGKNRR